MKPLTGQDAFFIYAETPEQHQHTLGVLILDPSTAPEPLTFERVVSKMQRDIGVIPEFRQRLSTVPVSISPPALVDDPNFKLENHLVHKTLPKPGNREGLYVSGAAGMRSFPHMARSAWPAAPVPYCSGLKLQTPAYTSP